MPTKDKSKQAAYAAKHYAANKEKMKARAKSQKRFSRKRNARHLFNFLSTHPCVDCAETDPIVLTFDHVRGNKSDNLANLARSACSITILIDEIAKCEVRCYNCHARRTAKQQGWFKLTIDADGPVLIQGS